jgi:tetratricopeptide (TPR) repeat protein
MIRSFLRLTTAALALSAALAPPLWAEGEAANGTTVAAEVESATPDSGAYLAARAAEAAADFRAAAGWYARALIADPTNRFLMEGSIYSNLNLGEIGLAAEVAKNIRAKGITSQLADMALLADEALHEDYAAIVKGTGEGRMAGALIDELSLAWATFGEGRMADALAEFDKVAATQGGEAYGLYHKAMALALAGDFEGAEAILSGKANPPLNLNRRGVVARIQILSQLERGDEALQLLERAFGTDPEPGIDAMRDRLKAGEAIPFTAIRTARDGIAEVFFTVATVTNGEADPATTLLHARVAAALRPDHAEALLLAAAMLESLQRYDLAVDAYAAFPPDDPAFYSAEIGRADALYEVGNKDAAIEAMQGVARHYPQLIVVQTALGDMLRRDERWEAALPAYEAAIKLAGTPLRPHWVLFFSRAICHERMGNWPAAEADFRKALELNPGRPEVLNYLGYALVERGQKLDEALKLIQEAVAAEPRQGYIIDSLAWAYFSLGRYDEALAPMEKASLLEPVDPIVTDHLGDVYWAVGRTREAEFQWHRALSFGPEEKDASRIRRKIEIGLDAVLAEEGAIPLSEVKAAKNGN